MNAAGNESIGPDAADFTGLLNLAGKQISKSTCTAKLNVAKPIHLFEKEETIGSPLSLATPSETATRQRPSFHKHHEHLRRNAPCQRSFRQVNEVGAVIGMDAGQGWAAVKSRIRPMTTSIFTPGNAALSRLSPMNAQATNFAALPKPGV